MTKPQQFPWARRSAGPAPLRRPGSIRRTTSIDSLWPQGKAQPRDMVGRARDLLTLATGEPVELSAGAFHIVASPSREILAIEVEPSHPRAREMVGVRAGGASRKKLAELMGDLRGTPTYQLLDDFAGASLVGPWIWSRWPEDNPGTEPGPDEAHALADRRRRMVDICTGFAAGASSLRDDEVGDISEQSSTEVGPLENPEDPAGWHFMPEQQGPQARRARRIDLWRAEGVIKVDAGFQDSGANPSGGRTAVHEYRIYAEIDEASQALVALQALPLILPYRECPGASIKATRMIGQKVTEFRDAVLDILPSTLGCTHLNDVLRALADVPALAERLPA